MKTKTAAARLTSLLAFIAGMHPLVTQSATPRSGESGRAAEPVVELSPFVVNSSKDTGYQATSTLAGTRLNTPLKDLGAAISIYTKEFLDDIGATNSSELLIFATSMDAARSGRQLRRRHQRHQRRYVRLPTALRENPQGAAGRAVLSAPTFTRDFFTSLIDIDTYNTDTGDGPPRPQCRALRRGQPRGRDGHLAGPRRSPAQHEQDSVRLRQQRQPAQHGRFQPRADQGQTRRAPDRAAEPGRVQPAPRLSEKRAHLRRADLPAVQVHGRCAEISNPAA